MRQMSGSPGKMLVLAGEQFACVKIIGRANFGSSIDFRTLVTELRQKGYTFFVLDLSECTLMDSTFLGVLAGFGLKMTGTEKGGSEPAIELLNPNARISELLENLGVLHLFRVRQGASAPPAGTETREHSPSNPPKDELQSACLEAHQTLMDIDPANVPKFKDLTQFLSEDLNKLKAGGR
jgi:anti-sigma B factor antagonist